MLARVLAAAALLALAAPAAADASARLDVTSAAPVALEARLEATFEGGAAFVADERWDGARSLRVAHGTITVWTWNATYARTTPPGGGPVTVARPLADARAETFALAEGWVRFDGDGGPHELRLVDRGGARFTLRGEAETAGTPTRLARSVASEVVATPADAFERAGTVPWRWEAGWIAAGRLPDAPEVADFPLRAPALDATGPVAVEANGGRVAFTDVEGRTHAFHLGVDEDAGSAAPGVVARPVETRRRAVLEIELEAADVAAGGQWGVGAPRAAWHLDGRIAWTRATGAASTGEERTTFRDARVEGDGVVRAELDPALGGAGEARYVAEGSWRALAVDGRPLVAAGASPGAAGAAASVLAVLAALAFAPKLLAALYTRIAPERVLEHPTRRRICEILAAGPLHRRELHRRVGGAWGPYTFHVRVLASAGVVRLRRAGAYVVVALVGAPGGDPAIPHPVARALYDALPEGGAPVRAAEVRRRLGLSRQLATHHWRALEARGLVRLLPGPWGGHLVQRAGQTGEPQSATPPRPSPDA